MGQWHKTGCVLCAQNCGLEVLVEDNRMVKVKKKPSHFGVVARLSLVQSAPGLGKEELNIVCNDDAVTHSTR